MSVSPINRSSQKSGVPHYSIGKRRIVEGELKNLIFAPVGQKPDIIIENSISNELRLIGDTDNCLFYNFEIGADGLQWNTLIEWWKENNKENDDDPELALYGRLRASLDSEPEKIFFRAYYNSYPPNRYTSYPFNRNALSSFTISAYNAGTAFPF